MLSWSSGVMSVSGFLESLKQLIKKGGFLWSPSGHGGYSLGKWLPWYCGCYFPDYKSISFSYLPFLSSPSLAILNSWQLSFIESQGRPEAAEFPAREKTCWRKDSGAGGTTCYIQELSYIVSFTLPVKAWGRAAPLLSLPLTATAP